MQEHDNLYVGAVLLFVAFIWGINPAVMKIGLLYLSPMPYNALRMLVAVAVVWAVPLLSGGYRPVAREDYKDIILVSLGGFFVFQLFFTVGVQQTTAGNASLLLGILPVSVAVINMIFKIEHISLSVAVGIMVSLLGVLLIVIGSGKEMSLAGDHLQGAVMLLAAQVGYGYYTVFSRPLLQKYSAYHLAACIITLSAVVFTLISLPALIAIEWSGIPLSAWLSVLYSGIFALSVGNFLWVWGVGKIGSAKTSLYNNLSPVFAIGAGYLFLGELFGWIQFCGAVVLFGGLYLTREKNLFAKKSGKPSVDGN